MYRYSKIFLLLLFCLILSIIEPGASEPDTGLKPITIGYIGTPSTNIFYSSMEELGFYEKNGLKVTPKYYSIANEAVDNMLNGTIDFVIINTYAVAEAVTEGKKPVIITSVIKIQDVFYLLIDQQKGITTIKDLEGKKIGLVMGDYWEYYLDQFLLINGIDKSKITLVPLSLEEIIPKLKSGEIDACVEQIQVASLTVKEDPLRYHMWSINNHENVYQVMVSNQNMQKNHPDVIEKLVKSHIDVMEGYNNNMDSFSQVILAKSGMNNEQIMGLLKGLFSEVSLTQGLLNVFESQTRYIINQKNLDINLPNYLDYVDFSFLDRINPEADTIIHE